MLVTQFATLEEPGSDEPDVLVVDIAHSLDDVVAATVATIQDAISQD
jgi:gluconokinase